MNDKLKTLFTMLLIGLLSFVSNETQAQKFFVGLAEGNITPPVGFPHYRGISTGVHDSLYAKAIYFRQGDEEAVLVECDLLWVSRYLSTDVRLAVHNETGIPYHNIIIAGTHSHTSPAYDEDIMELNEHERDVIPDPIFIDGLEYSDWLRKQIAQTIIKAKETSTASKLEIGRDETNEISFNRRYAWPGGRVQMGSGSYDAAVVQRMGPIDPEVGIVMFKEEDGTQKGVLVNFSVHADTKGGTEFSADFPAFLTQSLNKAFGPDFFTLYGQGACGNINHVNANIKPRLTSQEIGEKLAAIVKDNVDKLKPIQKPDLAVKSEMVYVPLQDFTKEELAWASDRNAAPLYDESAFFNRRRPMKIRSLQRIHENEAVPPTVPSATWHVPLEVQAIRISDQLAIVGLPGELFVEHGLAIKEDSPFAMTLVIELTNSHIAYVPTKEAFKQGSYETINSRVAPGGGEMMVETAINLLNSLH